MKNFTIGIVPVFLGEEFYLKFKERMMLLLQNAYRSFVFLALLIFAPLCIYGETCTRSNVVTNQKNEKKWKRTYYLFIEDFIESFIEIPTSNVTNPSSTTSSSYLAGRAPIYNNDDEEAGTCSASFLCMQNAENIYTDISNYLSVDNGLIVSWFTPTTLINLELDSIVHSMVTECIVIASTKIGFNPYYGETFNLVVSSDDEKIYFKFTKRKLDH